ncbi:acetyl-CoA carboxylase biotin carboxyl carrier protein subunit [Clostridia bacterium]|nr:acetyl-CoA carboxylase biotin carboxyl carrier protein subunit [Clostridia bacterium]
MKYNVTLNKKVYEVEVERGEAILTDIREAISVSSPIPVASAPVPPVVTISAPSAPSISVAGGEVVKAPMPGNILDFKVAVGQTVAANQPLVILESMKMENEILAPRAGTVGQLLRNKGDVVETDAPLLTLL